MHQYHLNDKVDIEVPAPVRVPLRNEYTVLVGAHDHDLHYFSYTVHTYLEMCLDPKFPPSQPFSTSSFSSLSLSLSHNQLM
jgi:hypothetical protein